MQTMQKLKLLPSLKEKKRYLVYKILAQAPLNQPDKALLNEITTLLGIYDSAKAGLQLITYNKDTKKGILRIEVSMVDKVKAILLMITQLNKTEVVVQSTYCTGLLNKAKETLQGDMK